VGGALPSPSAYTESGGTLGIIGVIFGPFTADEVNHRILANAKIAFGRAVWGMNEIEDD